MRKFLIFLSLAALTFVLVPGAQAQTETGTVTGVVTDPSGAVVPDAQVVAKSVATGAERSTRTNESGVYVISNLLPGIYDIRVNASGFASWLQRVQVTVGARVTVNAQLEVERAVETVEVLAAAGVVVNTADQTLSQVIDSKKITELPTLTRNPYALAATAGNVSEADPSGRGVGVAINGLRAASTAILLDGATNSDEFTATVGQAVPLDSVQEFSLLTNNFTAEFGRASGGIVNVATKSGSNEYHGTAYWFGRYSALTSNSFVNNAFGLPKTRFTRNQFGYSVGGRIVHDKLFFFQSTEWTRVRSFDRVIALVPTPQLLAVAHPNTQNFFSTLGTRKSNLTVLNTLTKTSATNIGGTTVCNTTGPCAALPVGFPMFDRVQYAVPSDAGGGDPQNTYSLVGRIDWIVSPNTQVYGRYALEDQEFLEGSNANSPYQGFDTGATTFNNNVLISVTHTFNPRLVSQSKIVFNRLNQEQPLGQFPNVPTLFFRTVQTRVEGTLTALPGYLPFNPGVGIPFGGPQNFGQVYEDVSYTRGSHQFRFGGSYVYIQDNRTFGAYANPSLTLGSNLPNAMDAFLNGVLLSFQSAVDPQGKFPCRFPLIAGQPCGRDLNGDGLITGSEIDPTGTLTLPVGQPSFSRSNRYHEFAFYGQDSWRVSRTFTLNFGLRWEYFGVQHNKDPRLDSNYYDAVTGSIFDRIAGGSVSIAPLSPIGGLWRKDWNNFAPRVGFAWDIFGDGRTSLRGGYGIAYERNFGNVTFNVIQNPPNYAVVSIISNVDVSGNIPISTDILGPLAGSSGTKALPPVSLRNVDAEIQTAYAHFWSLSLEREWWKNFLVALEYSGSKGVDLYSLTDPNRPGSGNVFRGLPCQTPDSPVGCRDRLTTQLIDGNGDGIPETRLNQYTNLNRRGQQGESLHNAFNLRVELNNFANTGLTLRTNYTWAHTFDNTSSTFSESSNDFNLGLLDPFDPKVDRGNAAFDIRHRVVISGIWEVPFARNTTGVWRRVLHGWQLSPIFTASTGSPFSIWDCTFAFFAVCPRMVLVGPIARKGPDNPPASGTPAEFRYIDIPSGSVGTYVHPITQNGEFGPFPANMTPRNWFRGPGSWNFDIGIMKTTQITERYSLQYRAEFFNAFNHANLFVLGSSAEVNNGFVSARRDGRRNIQMALKLIF